MVNLNVSFPEDLRAKAEEAARELGIPLDEFVRQCVSTTVNRQRSSDPLFADFEVFIGDAPSDLAAEHDQYLYR